MWNWNLDLGQPTLYLADLRPLGKQAEMIVKKDWEDQVRRFGEQKLTGLGNGLTLGNMTQSVARTTHNGAPVEVVTFAGNVVQAGETYRERFDYTVEVESKRLLSVQQYAGRPGQETRLVGTPVEIEYDVPIPANLRPQVGTVVPATLRIEETATTLKLIMSASGQDISNIHLPK